MKKIFFETLGGIIRFESDSELDFGKTEEALVHAYTPGAAITNGNQSVYSILHKESDTTFFSETDGVAHISGMWNRAIPFDFYHVLYGVARRLMIEKGMYPVHAACVGGESHVLVVGHSGSGKSSVVWKAIKNGQKLFSGNKTAIVFRNGMEAVAGTRTVTFSARDHDRLKQESILHSYEYGGRLICELDKVHYERRAHVPIRAIAIVRLNDFTEEKKLLSPESALHALYPLFLDVVNADVIVGGIGIVNGDISASAKSRFVKDFSAVLKEVPAYSLIGSSSCIADALGSL